MRAALGLLLVASAAAAEPTPTVKPVANVLQTFVPPQGWQELAGTQIGLLHTPIMKWGIDPGYGPSVFTSNLKQLRAETPVYYFRTNGAATQALYFPAKKGEGNNFIANWSVPLPNGGEARYDVARFGPTLKNRWGLRHSVHLVELEVNGGRGAPAYLHFVATGVKILDGTPGFAIQPERALDDAKLRWDRYLASQHKMLADTLTANDRATPGQPYGKETDEVSAVVIPTWLTKERQLRVVFYQRIRRHSDRTTVKTVAPQCPPGAPCLPPYKTPMTETRQYSVELAAEYHYDAAGTLVSITYYTPSGQ